MKKALRKEIAAKLASLSPEQIELQSTRTATALRSLQAYQQSQCIAFYMHMDNSEMRTDKMISNAFEDGKRVFLPNIAPYHPDEQHPWYPTQKTHLRMLEMPSLESVHQLVPRGKYKLKEPISGFNCLEKDGLDLIILPGVGFSADKKRIGHGAGFYDSFINEHMYTLHRTPRLIGVGLEEQLVDDIPTDEHDKRLDAVVINGKIYE